MKSFHNASRKSALTVSVVLFVLATVGGVMTARGALPAWIRNIEARTELEAAFFRVMPQPRGEVLFRRPPRETRAALGDLILKRPNDAELYYLRALEDEQQLDFAAAEADWKRYAENCADKAAGQLALADFYHRRLRPLDEVNALSAVAAGPASASEALLPATRQRSWLAFQRIFAIIRAQDLSKEVSAAQYRSWLSRYPREEPLYARFLEFLISQKDYGAATELLANYRKQFPGDEIFPVKGEALIEYRQGSLQQGLAVYERSFQPLWAPELVKSYFDLLMQTHSLRKFLDDARAALGRNPEDLNATARVLYYYQQQGKLEAAQEALTKIRLYKETAKSAWMSRELLVYARLLEDIHAYPEAARYYFALYNSKDTQNAQEIALAGLANLLLTAPETPIRLGSGELSVYKDIATLDPGPGYLNGILSLILNTTAPAIEFSEEERRAVPYFHRARAAELLALLDARFPNAPQRAELHEKLLEFYAAAGESEAVIKGGSEFLVAFPHAPQHTSVALLMADANSRTGKMQEEFAIYDSILKELAEKADKVPLGAGLAGTEDFSSAAGMSGEAAPEEFEEGAENEAADAASGSRAVRGELGLAFRISAASATSQATAHSPEYARLLERYLARLVELKRIPQALAVLRREIDYNPNDPGLYERLAVFLEQNRLGAEQEEIYRRAMARFPERSWYHKLARYYLRHQKDAEFERLTQEAVGIFKGSELEGYFQSLVGGSPAMYLRLNLYAHERFPHNPVFVRNLLAAYRQRETLDPQAWELLLRQHWFEGTSLRNEFFEYLTSAGQLDAEIRSLRSDAPSGETVSWDEFVQKNPAAAEYLAQADLWRSHYEDSAPILKALAAEYPADAELGQATSSVFRSLAYFDPTRTAVAAAVEENLLAADPRNTKRLARIGDIYADRELFVRAAPYWERIAIVAPGEASGYLDAATIYWDYFDFSNALRLLGEGRKILGNEDLYCYEAGAIYEGKREYPQAIQEYIRGSLAAGGDSPAENRLLELARRTKYRDLVKRAAEKLASGADFSLPEVLLRVRVLEAQNQKPQLASFLDSLVGKATTIEQAADIENLAQQRSLETIRQHALEKEASLASDPVRRLQLRYALVQLYESRKDFASAQINVEELYRENPKIMGVVRSTVDFYWRMKLYPQAIAVLQRAAEDAYPGLSKQFAFEAARKSTEARFYPQARDLLAQLLKDSLYDSQYLAAMAETYAKAGDQQGLKQFYLDEIAFFRNVPISTDERKTQIAALRRGLIPALARLDDFAGAVDQCIELINAFPEDESLTTEGALYAARSKRQQQIVDFYTKTIQQSPRDYRWSMVLARIQVSLEDFSAAIESYGKAIAVRPDRADLRIARASLAERLMRFDDAANDYEHVYQLAYKDPKWMERIAEVRARQGKVDDAVAALKAALIDGRPERADHYFEVARRLEGWGMLARARGFAEQGLNAAGRELLAAKQNHDGANVYARIMTRLRQPETAYTTLQNALSGASASLPMIKEQVAKEGIAAVTDSEWRKRTQQTRTENARKGMQSALTEMGDTAPRYFTPEEKVSFAQFAQKLREPMSLEDVEAFAVPLAQHAGLGDLEAAWRYELMLEPGKDSSILLGRMNAYVVLQQRRLKFSELGPQLERFAPRLESVHRNLALFAAADAYRAAGDPENELRVLTQVGPAYMGGEVQKHFLELLLKRRPQELVHIAASWTPWGEQAADFVVAHGDSALAHAVVSARGRTRPPVWSDAYGALSGLYFAETSPEVNSDFLRALGDQSIGERLSRQLDRNRQLAGDTWFYYGSRYGEYLGATNLGDAEDFLPAALEHSPASASAYLTLADYYAENGDTRAAIRDYNHVLELAPGRADIHDRLALAYYKQDKRAQAVSEWKQVFSMLADQVNSARVPESFWADFAGACDHLSARGLFADVKAEADALLRVYLRHNGNYRSSPLLRSAYLALRDNTAGTAWLLDLASAAPDPIAVLTDLADSPWIPLPQRALIYQRILEAKHSAFEKMEGLEKDNADEELRSWQVRWAKYLIQTKQFERAADYLAGLPQETKDAKAASIVPLELQAAAQLETLDRKVAGYLSDPSTAPAAEILRASARQLFEAGDKQSARKVLEFVFAREIDEHKLIASSFLGLAEIRISVGDTAGALELLRRLVIVVGSPFENLDPAAALLEKMGHNREAVEFLDQAVKATPWELPYRLRLAKARIAAGPDVNAAQGTLAKIASSGESFYSVRVEAATALASVQASADLGSRELKLLATCQRGISAKEADQPFYYDARLRAGQKMADSQTKLRLLESALADTPVRDDARIPLFHTAANLQADEFALAVSEPLLNRQFLRGIPAEADNDEEFINSEGDRDDQEEERAVVYAETKLTHAQQQQIAWSVGNIMLRLGRLNDASRYLELARRLEKSSSRRKEILARLTEVRSQLRRQQLNEAGQPILQQDLEQDRLVRPRITARIAPPRAGGRGRS